MIAATINFSGSAEYFLQAEFNAEAAILAPLLKHTDLVVTGLYPFLSQDSASDISSGTINLLSLLVRSLTSLVC